MTFLIPDWPAPATVHAVFTLRTGGVSVSPYDSLNVGMHVGDAPAAVAENRRRVREVAGLPAEPLWLQQVHGSEVVEVVTKPVAEQGATSPRADAAVTRERNCVCVVQVADCMPVLFAAQDGSVVGAAHAGWRGLAGGVLEASVRKLGVSPEGLMAWMGPAIGQANFEVGDDVRDTFVATDAGSRVAFTSNERGRWQCDLYELAKRRLAAMGIGSVHGGGWCTYADRSRFFSYRRDGQCGRMAAIVWME